MRKLDDVAVEQLRDRFAGGESSGALAEAFGVSERHVRRLVAGVERPPPRFEVNPDESVEAALARFLGDTGRDEAGDVRAALARTVARRIDSAGSRDVPALARALVDLLGELRGEGPPDAVDELRRRREARLLAAASTGFGAE